MEKKNQLKSCCKNGLSSREVVARDLPHPMMLSLLNRKQQPYFMREAEDPGTLRAAKLSGMTHNLQGVGPVQKPYGAPLRSGFTLIELLVVVLIIGILAAVAVPQYQKAVEKSRAAQALTMLKTVYDAAKAYQLSSGNWPENFDELAVEIPWTGTTNGVSYGHHRHGKSNPDWSIQILNSSTQGNAITVGRISGPYTGASFYIYDVPHYSQFAQDELV